MSDDRALTGQAVVVIGGSAGIGLETARRARAEGADVILAGRDPDRLARAAAEVGAGTPARSTPPTPTRSSGSSGTCPQPIDHVMVTAGRPYYAPFAESTSRQARRSTTHLWLPMPSPGARSARYGPGERCCSWAAPAPAGRHGLTFAAMTAAMPALTANLALEIAPIRVNLIAAGFVDTPLSARCSATTSTGAATSYGPRCPSAGWSDRRTSPRSPCTSW